MASSPSNLHEYSVSELSGALKGIVEDNFSLVRVRGELGRVVRAASGHMYLDLKDERAVVNGVIWKGNAGRLKIDPEQGMEVVATGKMTTFPGQSRYQIIIDSLEPAGVGALMALFEKRKQQLAQEGLFAEERKQELPYLPGVIGVVTSPSGAVIRDILHRLRERFPSRVLVWPTLVQGKQAEKQIVAAINGFNKLEPDGDVPRPDVIIVARGGGSLEDLWCFNEEAVARAVAASDIPLVSAVGHETDTTLIDYVADQRAPTPTAAAEIATPVRADLLSELLNKERRLVDAHTRMMETARSGFKAAVRGLGNPEDILGANEQRLDRATDRLTSGLRARLDGAGHMFARVSGRVSPGMLAAGFEMRDGRLLRAAGQLQNTMRRVIERRADRLQGIVPGSSFIRNMADHGAKQLLQFNKRLNVAAGQGIGRHTDRLLAIEKILSTLSHHNVLARGFALVRDETGALLRSASDIEVGASGSVEFVDGQRGVDFGQLKKSKEKRLMVGKDSNSSKPLSPSKKSPQAKKKSTPIEAKKQANLFDQ